MAGQTNDGPKKSTNEQSTQWTIDWMIDWPKKQWNRWTIEWPNQLSINEQSTK